MEVSILVTVKNDVENMRRLLDSLKNVRGNYELVIVDAYSTDGTYELILKEKDNFNLKLDRLKGNRATGRNRTIEISTGKMLAFIDSDSEVTPDWLENLLNHSNEDIIAGKIIQKSQKRWADLGRVPIYVDNKDVTYPSNNLIYNRKVIDKIGMFDTKFHTAEDVDLNIRAVKSGFLIKEADDVVIFHYPREDYISLIKQSYYDGIGRKILKRKYGVGSKLNVSNLRRHPVIESSRLLFGMIGYIFGGF